MEEFEDYGPRLQVKMFEMGHVPDFAAVDDFAERARRLFRDAGIES